MRSSARIGLPLTTSTPTLLLAQRRFGAALGHTAEGSSPLVFPITRAGYANLRINSASRTSRKSGRTTDGHLHIGRCSPPPSIIQGKTYVTRWGTWRKTLEAFVDWANSDDRAKEPGEPNSNTRVPEEPAKEVVRTESDCREVRPGLRFKVFMRDRFRCLACGRSPATHLNIELHADHILAVANRGKTVIENLQTLCQECNLGKGRIVLPNS